MGGVIAVWILAGWFAVSILAAPALSALCRVTARAPRRPERSAGRESPRR